MIGGNSVFRTFDSSASPSLSRLQLECQWKSGIQNIYYSSNMKKLKPTLKFEDEVLVLEIKIKPNSPSLSPPFSLPSLTSLSLSLFSLTHPYRFCCLKKFNLLLIFYPFLNLSNLKGKKESDFIFLCLLIDYMYDMNTFVHKKLNYDS